MFERPSEICRGPLCQRPDKLTSVQRILGVLAGRAPGNRFIADLAPEATLIIAADSGQDICLEHGVTPQIVVGDFDSLSHRIPGVEYRQDTDQDRSDCDKLLDEIKRNAPDEVILAGFEGDRLDHMLAGLTSLALSGLAVQICLQGGTGHILFRGDHDLGTLKPGRTVSIIPIGGAEVTLTGFRWPLERAILGLGSAVSLSNQTENAPRIEIFAGCVLLIVEGEQAKWTSAVS